MRLGKVSSIWYIRGFYITICLLLCSGALKANPYIDSLKQELTTTSSVEDLVKINNYLAWEYRNIYLDSGLLFANKALSIAKQNELVNGKINSLITIAVINDLKGELDLAIDNYYEALAIARKQKLEDKSYEILEQIAITYIGNEMYTRARIYYDSVEINVSVSDNSYERQRFYFNYAVLLKKDNDLDLARAYYRKVELENPTDPQVLGQLYSNIANVKQEQMDYDSAVYFYRKSLKNLDVSNHLMLAKVYNGLTDVALGTQRYQNALEFSDSALHYATISNNMRSEIYALSNKSLAYEFLGDFKKAHQFLRSYNKLNDSLVTTANKNYVLELEQKYQNEKQARQIDKLESDAKLDERERDLLQTENKLTKTRYRFLIGLMIALAIAIIVIFYALRLRYTKNLQIQKEKQKLKENQIKQKSIEIERYKSDLKNYTDNLLKKNALITEMEDELEQLYQTSSILDQEKSERINTLVNQKILTEDDWKSFRQLFIQVYPDFFVKLQAIAPSLTKSDQRIAALIMLGLNQDEMADLLGISKDSVRKGRYRLRQKLNIADDHQLTTTIQSIS